MNLQGTYNVNNEVFYLIQILPILIQFLFFMKYFFLLNNISFLREKQFSQSMIYFIIFLDQVIKSFLELSIKDS